MKQGEWRTSSDVRAMLGYVRANLATIHSRFRLFALAVCERFCVNPSLDEQICMNLVRNLVNTSSQSEIDAYWRKIRVARIVPGKRGCAWHLLAEDAYHGAISVAQFAAAARDCPWQATLARCIFGGVVFSESAELFRSPAAAKVLNWRGGLVKKICQSIWDREAFDELPILADAVEEAGCDASWSIVLDHLRGKDAATPRHARGCWVIDRLLGKG